MSKSLSREDVKQHVQSNVSWLKLIPLSLMKKEEEFSWPSAEEKLLIGSNFLTHLLRLVAGRICIDEVFYLRKYTDVGLAIEQGLFKNAQHHYEAFGFFEDRQPYPMAVDSDYYLNHNVDVRESIKVGLVSSAQSHFDRHGWSEGRLPTEDFSLLNLPGQEKA